MSEQLPTCPPEGTPTDLPKNLLLAVSRLAPGWSHSIVWGRATTLVREPKPDQRADGTNKIGQGGDKRTTMDVPRLLESVSLRVRHENGVRAFAYWVRIDKAKGWTPWAFADEGAGVLVPGCAPDYTPSWAEFYEQIQWIDDEDMEQAA